MDKSKSDQIEYLNRIIIEHTKAAQKAIELINALPDGLPDGLDVGIYGAYLRLPYDVSLLRQVRLMLGDDWGMVKGKGRHWTDDNGNLYLTFRHNTGDLMVILQTERKGSVCHRVQVGTKTAEIPIYKIVCDNAKEAV